MIEEFMLLANMTVAHRTHKFFRDKALLRRHADPKPKLIIELVTF